MNKLSKVLPVVAFLLAVGSAMLSKAEEKPITYYRWNMASPSQCVVETECQENGPTACGHTSFTPGLTTNCDAPVNLRKI